MLQPSWTTQGEAFCETSPPENYVREEVFRSSVLLEALDELFDD